MMSETAVRSRRAQFNDAIARRDAEAIASFLLPNYHIVTGHSEQRSSREESRGNWTALFEKDPLVIFVRTPGVIQVNELMGMAHESGEWTGKQTTVRGPMEITGVYAAKWHRVEGEWLLQAEIFTPLTFRAL